MEKIARAVMIVTHFCQAPKDAEVLAKMDAWAVYTGDGLRLAEHVLERAREVAEGRRLVVPPIFITGQDNLLLAEGGTEMKASHLGQWLVEYGVLPSSVICDDDPASQYTHGQARRLIQFANERGWKKIALFSSGHHVLQSWLTTLGQMDQRGADLLVIPEPAYGLSFFERNPELAGAKDAWGFFVSDGVPRILKYQTAKQPPDAASWERAVEYLHQHYLM